MASAANIWAAAWEALEPGAEGAAATAMGIITGAAMAAMEELTALISEVAAGEVGALLQMPLTVDWVDRLVVMVQRE